MRDVGPVLDARVQVHTASSAAPETGHCHRSRQALCESQDKLARAPSTPSGPDAPSHPTPVTLIYRYTVNAVLHEWPSNSWYSWNPYFGSSDSPPPGRPLSPCPQSWKPQLYSPLKLLRLHHQKKQVKQTDTDCRKETN